MFKKQITIKEQQEAVVEEISWLAQKEWKSIGKEKLPEIMRDIVSRKRSMMENIFSDKFVKLSYLFVDAQDLAGDIEEFTNNPNKPF